MSNIILFHGTGGDPEEAFFPWLKEELEADGHKVFTPTFPTPSGQSLESWFKSFKLEKQLNSETILVGRSIGAVFILRLLEKSKVKVKACFLIAGFISDLGLKEFTPLISTFVNKPFDWKKINSNCEDFFVYCSDNDPYVSPEKVEELASKIDLDPIVVEGVGHFTYRRFPRLLKDIRSL